jgi:FAD/FMN-containing dehydrogenase
LRYDTDAFRQSIDGYWAQQEREVAQAAIIQPRNASELSKVIAFLKKEYDMRCVHKEKFDDVLFAIRGGGQSPVAGSASANGGILIDLSLFREITVAEKRQSVVIGAGCRWIDVSRILDEKGLSVVGGRSSEVGVAGFTLGGKHVFSTFAEFV